MSLVAVGDVDLDEDVVIRNVDGVDAVAARIGECRQLGLLDDAVAGGHDDEFAFLETAHRQEGADLFAFGKFDHVDDRFALGEFAADRDLVDFDPVGFALGREEENVVVRRGDEQMLDEVFFLDIDALHAAAAAILFAVGGGREALDVALMADGDDHVLFGDEVFDGDFFLGIDDLGAALVAVLVLQSRSVQS